MIKSGSRTGGTGPVMKKRGGALKKAGGGGVNAGSHAGSAPNPGQKAGSKGGFSLPASAWDNRNDWQRAADAAKRLVNIPAGNNATIKIGGSLSSPSLTYTKQFKKGGAIKKSSSPAKKSGGRSCW